jgi:hypothetical protein
MIIFLCELNSTYSPLLFHEVVKLFQKGRFMNIKALFKLEIFIWRLHNIIKIAIGNLQVIKAADIALSGNLGSNSNVSDSGKFYLLHEGQLQRMLIAPF